MEDDKYLSPSSDTFKKSTSTYEWIKALEKYVDYGLITKEFMENVIKDKIKK